MTDLGRRAVACKAWRWMPGMLDDDGYRCVGVYDDGTSCWVYEGEACTSRVQTPALPDLTDPATLGCVLALDRGLYGDPDLYAGRFSTLDGERWCVMTIAVGGGPAFMATSEAEALVLALEAAPVLS